MEEEWIKSQGFEKNWWLTCKYRHPYEIIKGDFVARIMMVDRGVPNKTVIDIGAGPLSLLQRIPVKEGTALDPIYYDELEDLYKEKSIKRLVMKGEDLDSITERYDEAWIYNCLQHVVDPVRILKNAMLVAPVVRIFEWINIPPYEGHLHMLTPDLLQRPFNQAGWTTIQKSTGLLNHDDLGSEYFSAIFQNKQSTSLDPFET
jgi:hypothetical protein